MPRYYVRFNAMLEGETFIDAEDAREAIEILDTNYFPRNVLDDFEVSSFLINSIQSDDS